MTTTVTISSVPAPGGLKAEAEGGRLVIHELPVVAPLTVLPRRRGLLVIGGDA